VELTAADLTAKAFAGRAQETSADSFLLVSHFNNFDGFAHAFFSKHLAEACKR
jgi:hypothetical protein